MNTSIGSFFKFIGLISLAIVSTVLYLVNDVQSTAEKLDETQNNRYQTRIVADMLRQSSDDLTRLARQYVVTGNEKYKKEYNSVVYIRDGEYATPKNYHNIYWDLLEPLRSKSHPLQKKVPFEQIIEELPFDKYELSKLKKAKKNSDELVNIEIEAFSAMAGLFKDKNGDYTIHGSVDQKKAIELLHSDDYLKAKQNIMLPIDEFLEHLEQRTLNDVKQDQEKLDALKVKIYALSSLLVFILLLSFFLIKKKIIDPIKSLSVVIDGFRQKKDVKKKIYYDDEIGYMTEVFFKMKEDIDEDMKLIGENKRDMEEYLKLVDQNIITSSTDLNGRITYVSDAFSNISGYKKEELLGKKHSIVKHPDMKKEIYEEMWKSLLEDRKWEGEIKNKRKDGSYYWVKATIYPNYDNIGKKVGYTAIRVDITSKKQVDELLEDSKIREQKIQKYIELIDKNIITSSTDINGNITYVSEAFANISGYSKEELIGETHRLVKHEDNDPSIYESMWETISNNRVWHGIVKNKKKDGGFYWVDATIYPTFDDNGEKTGYTAIRLDITDKKKVESLLITDSLTDIYNRRYFNEMFPKAINIAKRDRKYLSLAIIDIDYFKQYNDKYGHQEGDEALTKVAQSIKNSLQRASDMCFRLGGEEFSVVFGSLDPKEAFEFADKIRENVENLKIEHSSGVNSFISVSVGIATVKIVDGIDEDTIYKKADNLLYKAKKLGRNRVEAEL